MHTEKLFVSDEMGYFRVMSADENGAYTIADMHCDDQEANAQLFAASPELLAVVRYALSVERARPQSQQEPQLIGMAEAAIAKATGQ